MIRVNCWGRGKGLLIIPPIIYGARALGLAGERGYLNRFIITGPFGKALLVGQLLLIIIHS